MAAVSVPLIVNDITVALLLVTLIVPFWIPLIPVGIVKLFFAKTNVKVKSVPLTIPLFGFCVSLGI